MTGETHTIRAIDLDEGVLAATVAGVLSSGRGQTVRVESVRREPSAFATLFPAEVLSVSLEDGSATRLFLKHLGPEQPGQPDKQPRDREVRVYQRLLRDESLPVPRFYGSRWNPTTGRLEVYLEYVDDWPLKYHGLEHWVTAARRLGQLHAHFAARGDALQGCDFLLRLDGTYFADWGRRAVPPVAARAPDLAGRLERVLEAYRPVCDLLSSQPHALVHNDLAPKNVIADRSQTPVRICFVDWEMAGVGCGLLDLVHLKYGLSPRPSQDMLAAYRAELQSTGLLPDDEAEFGRLLAACELHKTLYRVAHSADWNLPLATLTQWVTEAEDFLRTARGGGEA